MAVTTNTTYLQGLGDLFVKAQRPDTPSKAIDNAESVSNWSGVSGAQVSRSQAQVLEGTYSIAVTGIAGAGDGAELTFSPSVDYSANEDSIALFNIYPTSSNVMEFTFNSGANSETYRYSTTGGKWNRVLLDLSSPYGSSGTTDWSSINSIEITSVSGDSGNFYIDSAYLFDSLADTAREENIRIGCLNEIGVEESDESVELRCSRNDLVETRITSTEVTLTATVQDFDPTGLALLKAGEVTSDDVTSQVESETFSVPATGPYTYTIQKADQLRIGGGYGLWVYNQATGQMLQQTPEPTLIFPGYYYVNPQTGVITFNAAQAGVTMSVTYNYVTGAGRSLMVKTDRDFQEFALQFLVKGSNNKEALFFFPKIKANTSSLVPSKEEFWTWTFEARVLADELTQSYYTMHVNE